MTIRTDMINAIDKIVADKQSEDINLSQSDLDAVITAHDNAVITLNSLKAKGINVSQALKQIEIIKTSAQELKDGVKA